MRKFIALYTNECIKLTHRILLIVGIVALLLVPFIIFLSSSRNLEPVEIIVSDEGYIAKADELIAEYEERYDNISNMYGDEIDPADWWGMVELESAGILLDEAKSLRDADPKQLSIVYMANVLENYSYNQAILNTYETMIADAGDNEVLLEEAENFLFNMTRNLTYEDLVEAQKAGETVLDSGLLEDYINYRFVSGDFTKGVGEVMDNEAAYRALWNKVSVNDELIYNREMFYTLESVIDGYMRRSQSLQTGQDDRSYENRPLTPLSEASIEREMGILLYQIEHPNYLNANTGINSISFRPPAANRAYNNAFSAMYLILIIGMLILAASTVSQEIETGTIKALIISPTKRYKIILAKFIALISLALGLALMTILWIQLLSLIFFGSGSLPGLVVSLNGNVFGFPPMMATLVRLLLSLVQLIMFIIIGMTLSTVMRHTAIAVGLSIGIFFANMIAQLIMLTMSFSETIRLLPFFNIDFSGRVGASLADWLFGGMFTNHYELIPLEFSVIYTLILGAVLLWITFDSFIRRDI